MAQKNEVKITQIKIISGDSVALAIYFYDIPGLLTPRRLALIFGIVGIGKPA